MKLRKTFSIFIFLISLVGISNTSLAYPPQRIVSLAPNITEIIFALGAQDRLVGVTSYCHWPPEARKIGSVGGFLNPNIEVIIERRPDLVIVTPNGNNKELVETLEKLKIQVLVCPSYNISQIFDAVEVIGKTLGLQDSATKIISEMGKQVKDVEKLVKGAKSAKVAAIVGRRPLIVVGNNEFISDLIKVAGGQNLVSSGKIRYPHYSYEELIVAGPDVIIDLSVGNEGSDVGCAEAINHWKNFSTIPAIKNNRVYCLDNSTFLIPGPRAVGSVAELARLLHPEVY